MRCATALALVLLAAWPAMPAGAAAIPWTTEPKEPAPGAEKPLEPQTPPPAYLERQQSCPQCQPCKEDSLILPLVKSTGVVAPQKAAAGQAPLPEYGDRRTEYIWQVVPWQAAHEEFLRRLASAKTDDEKFALAAWCAANRLAPCDEFLWRDILRLYWYGPGQPSYQKALALWLPGAGRRAPPFVFDLPVRGEWYVERDEAGLHRRKHGAAFARNLIVLRNGRTHAGSPGDVAGYFAWNQPFYAIADGLIAKVDDRHPDPPAGRGVGIDDANYITQDCGGGVYAYYGHIKSASAEVKAGQAVRAGQALGRVGNSGSHGLPHLHFILMDADYFSVPGRYRLEQLAGGRWTPRDGAELAEDSFIRPPPAAQEPAPTPGARPARPGPVRKGNAE